MKKYDYDNNTLDKSVTLSADSFLQKHNYQKQWLKFCKKHNIKNTTLVISDWIYNPNIECFYNKKLGVKLRQSIPLFLMMTIPVIGWIYFGVIARTRGVLSFVKMKTGNLVKVEE
ncbi:MAG: hypothetical protein LBF36_02140 [Mycoplasmataceae bacterium]|jgi:hypothetical protein|nr:hypothetical protein [Mycoplasmataceae bacterium]